MVLGVDSLAWGAFDHSDPDREQRAHDRPTDDLRKCGASEAREHSGAVSGDVLRSIHRAAARRGRIGARVQHAADLQRISRRHPREGPPTAGINPLNFFEIAEDDPFSQAWSLQVFGGHDRPGEDSR